MVNMQDSTPLLKKRRYVKTCSTMAAVCLDRPIKYWENLVKSPENKIDMFDVTAPYVEEEGTARNSTQQHTNC